jgi:hypothetical protein
MKRLVLARKRTQDVRAVATTTVFGNLILSTYGVSARPGAASRGSRLLRPREMQFQLRVEW